MKFPSKEETHFYWSEGHHNKFSDKLPLCDLCYWCRSPSVCLSDLIHPHAVISRFQPLGIHQSVLRSQLHCVVWFMSAVASSGWKIRGNFHFMSSTAPDTSGRRNIDQPCVYPSLSVKPCSLCFVGSESLRRTTATGEQFWFRNQPHDIISNFYCCHHQCYHCAEVRNISSTQHLSPKKD